MPTTPVRSSNLAQQSGVDSASCPVATINGVAAANCLVAVVAAYRASTPSGNLIDGYTSTIGGTPANSWSLAARVAYSAPGSNHRTELTFWVAPNSAAGNTAGKPDFTYEDGSTNVWHHFDEWPGMPTSGVVDKTATGTAASNSAAVATATTATLAQAAEIVIGAVANRYNYAWGGSDVAPGVAPSGFTVLKGETSNSNLAAQSFYKEVSSTAAQSFSQAQVNQGDNGAVAALVTLKLATTQYRVEITGINAAVDGAAGLTAFVWTANPKDVKATEYTGVTAQATGGKIFLAPAPAGTVDGQVVNCVVYQPASTKGLVALVPGTVKAY